MRRQDPLRLRRLGLTLVLAAVASTAVAHAQGAAPKVAVIDSDRIVAESTRGKQALERLKQVQDEKLAQARAMQNEINELRKRIEEGKLSLAPERLVQMNTELEDKVLGFRRFQDDADRELSKLRDENLAIIEKDVLEVINAIGREGGYTLVFNKFRSGLVYADDAVDITDEVIQRFNAARPG